MSKLRTMGWAALLVSASAPAFAADVDLTVNYDWTSPVEKASIQVLYDAVAKQGVKAHDFAVVQHDTGSKINIINMVAGGTPPDVFMANDPNLFRDLKSQGYGTTLDSLFAKIGATANFPDVVRKGITVDGEIVKAPVDLDFDGIVYYNKEVAAKAGVDPAAWKSLDDFWADYDKIAAAGFIPVAIGSQQWQESYLFHALMAAVSPEIFDGFYAAKPDASLIDTPAMRKVLDELRRFQQHTDPGSPNRDWNATTNLVITGKALMQIHGSWMKGEFRAAGKVAGKDYGCVLIPGAKGVSVTVDTWGFINTGKPEITDAQMKFASASVNPQVSADFAYTKGSTPVVLNAPTDKLDVCNTVVLDTIRDPSKTHSTPHDTADPDWFSATWDVIDHFWTNPAMTNDQAIAEFKKAYDAVF